MAVYSPDGKRPWDDAVTLVLTYAEIPYDVWYDTQILTGELPKYDWLHLHHEGFTVWQVLQNLPVGDVVPEEVDRQSATAQMMGFQKVR